MMKIPSSPVRNGAPRARALAATVLSALALLSACTDMPTEVSSDGLRTSPALESASSPVDVSWPKDGSWIKGSHPLKATLEGYSLKQYSMYWQVDGGRLNPMYNSYADWPHKEAWANVDSWTWKGTGPYHINFVAKNRSGKIIAQRSIAIYVGNQPAAAPAAANPLAGARFFVDPYSNAKRQADAWRSTRPADAQQMDQIARRSQADWFGDWSGDIQSAVRQRTATIAAAGALPVYVAYNIPVRDCNSYSAGGATSPEAYRTWIRSLAAGIGSSPAVVVLEPDALGLLNCLSAAEQQIRIDLIRDAVQVLKAQGRISVYIDAGHARWHPADLMAVRLKAAGIDLADGFALNVSNYVSNADNLAYGEALSRQVGGKHFLMDTSRNGLGPSEPYEWCNPSGRALGHPPTTSTGHPLVDAYLWLKRPGESDGTCNGGPNAGAWWADYALGLAQRMPQTLAMLP